MSKAGDFLRDRREELGLPQGQVARRAGVDQSTLSKAERGLISTSPDLLQAVAPILKVEVQFLYKLAGLLPESTKVASPEPAAPDPERLAKAIRGDQHLTNAEKRVMLEMYDALVKAKEGRG